MNVYLTIMVTVLVVTQVIRITQNTIQLAMQKKKFDEQLGWLDRNEVTEEDFETQRKVYKMLYKLLSENDDDSLGLFAPSNIDYMHTPSVDDIIANDFQDDEGEEST